MEKAKEVNLVSLHNGGRVLPTAGKRRKVSAKGVSLFFGEVDNVTFLGNEGAVI